MRNNFEPIYFKQRTDIFQGVIFRASGLRLFKFVQGIPMGRSLSKRHPKNALSFFVFRLSNKVFILSINSFLLLKHQISFNSFLAEATKYCHVLVKAETSRSSKSWILHIVLTLIEDLLITRFRQIQFRFEAITTTTITTTTTTTTTSTTTTMQLKDSRIWVVVKKHEIQLNLNINKWKYIKLFGH